MLIGEGHDWHEGEERAWRLLSCFKPGNVCLNAQVEYDTLNGDYIIPILGRKVIVSPEKREIRGDSSEITDFILDRLPHYSRLSILWYLIGARDMPLSSVLIHSRELKDGLLFTGGSHTLPLDKLVERYGKDIDGFLKRGNALGGERMEYRDASVRLLPFPRVPVVLILWKADDEFPARADILFDSTVSLHLPTDIIWSTAMMTILAILGG